MEDKMAYIDQEKKKKIAPKIKEILKKYNVKGSLSVDNHSTLVLTLSSGSLDFLGAESKIQGNDTQREYIQVNPYYMEEWCRKAGETKIADFFSEIIPAMKSADWYDRSDLMTDYFDTAYYISINVGKWNNGYKLIKD